MNTIFNFFHLIYNCYYLYHCYCALYFLLNVYCSAAYVHVYLVYGAFDSAYRSIGGILMQTTTYTFDWYIYTMSLDQTLVKY